MLQAVEISAVECSPVGNGSGRISIAKIRTRKRLVMTLQRNFHCGELLPSND
jgi:hypothetical protein